MKALNSTHPALNQRRSNLAMLSLFDNRAKICALKRTPGHPKQIYVQQKTTLNKLQSYEYRMTCSMFQHFSSIFQQLSTILLGFSSIFCSLAPFRLSHRDVPGPDLGGALCGGDHEPQDAYGNGLGLSPGFFFWGISYGIFMDFP